MIKKVWKQVEDGMELIGCHRIKAKSNAFAILTCLYSFLTFDPYFRL